MLASAAAATKEDASLAMGSDRRANPGRKVVALISNGSDFSHTLNGESLIDRSKDPSNPRKSLAGSATVSPRCKKVVSSNGRPKWETALSVLAKNCVLLAALLWVGQMVWSSNEIPDTADRQLMPQDYEAHVAEVEVLVKKTAKLFQVQLEVLDKKIRSGAENVRNVVEKMELFEKDVKLLELRIGGLDESLGDLKDMGLVSKEEFESFWHELKKSRSLDKSEQEVNLDKIRAFARSVVEKEIEKHAADGLGRVDYALASSGARVVKHSQPYSFAKAESWFAAFRGRHGVHGNAHKMLQPSFGEPGLCFALEGSSGFVQVKLRTAIIPQAVTLEHVSKSVAYDRSSAPKDGKVFGWLEEPTDDPSRPPAWYLMARISYDLEKSNIQTFSVEPGIVGAVNMIRFEIDSNHGSSALTCIYRFRVHGYEPSSPAAMDIMQA